MSEVIGQALELLSGKDFASLGGRAIVVIKEEGSILLDAEGAHSCSGEEDVDVTLTASADVFLGILDGSTNPAGAFMTGKLKVDGNMGMAMKLSSLLA